MKQSAKAASGPPGTTQTAAVTSCRRHASSFRRAGAVNLVQLPGGFDAFDVDGKGYDTAQEAVHEFALIFRDGPRFARASAS